MKKTIRVFILSMLSIGLFVTNFKGVSAETTFGERNVTIKIVDVDGNDLSDISLEDTNTGEMYQSGDTFITRNDYIFFNQHNGYGEEIYRPHISNAYFTEEVVTVAQPLEVVLNFYKESDNSYYEGDAVFEVVYTDKAFEPIPQPAQTGQNFVIVNGFYTEETFSVEFKLNGEIIENVLMVQSYQKRGN